MESYHNTLWKTENDTWVCEDPGLSELTVSINTHPYDWYNHLIKRTRKAFMESNCY